MLPHGIILALALLLILADLLMQDEPWRGPLLTAMSVIGYVGAIISVFRINGLYKETFSRMIRADDLSGFLIITIISAALLTVFIAATTVERLRIPIGEFYALLAFSTLGGMMVAASTNLIMIYVGIELSSLAVFVMAALTKRRRDSIEAALKYFLLSAFATAILLYGMAWLYGVTGSLNLGDISLWLAGTANHNQQSLLLAALLLIVGLGFKAAAVPFHMWTPDAYQGAPTPVTAFMSVAPKVTAFAAMVRILVQGLEPMRAQWVPIVIVLSVLTMALGNIVAIAQRDIKRMLAYSSIAHTGYMMVGLASFIGSGPHDTAISALLFYNFAYTFMNIGAFALIAWLESRGFGANLEDFNGLATTAPLHAAAMAVFLFSLTGVPPLIGFYGKYYLIQAALSANLTWLAVVVVIFSAISAFYYLRVVAAMYFGEATEAPEKERTPFFGLGLGIMAAATLLLGIFSGPIFDLARQWYLSL